MTLRVLRNGDLAADSVADFLDSERDFSMMEVLHALTEGLYARYGNLSRTERAEKYPQDNVRWGELLDLMHYFDERAGHDRPVSSRENIPDTDPLTLIDRLQSEGFINEEVGDALRGEFNAKAKDILGHELTKEQLAALRRLILNFDVGQTLKSEKNQPRPESDHSGVQPE